MGGSFGIFPNFSDDDAEAIAEEEGDKEEEEEGANDDGDAAASSSSGTIALAGDEIVDASVEVATDADRDTNARRENDDVISSEIWRAENARGNAASARSSNRPIMVNGQIYRRDRGLRNS